MFEEKCEQKAAAHLQVNVKSENSDRNFEAPSPTQLFSAHAFAEASVSPRAHVSLSPKAQAIAQAHRGRVEAEAQAYLDSQIRKLEARAQKLQAKAERRRMHEEAKALQVGKQEQARADQAMQNAQVKADKILSKAREDALRIKAHASEHMEKAIADAYTRAERWKAGIEETKKKEVAEITERVHLMIALGELPSSQQMEGVVKRIKNSWAFHP